MALVVDTGVLLASFDRTDAYHNECAELLRVREDRVIPAPVIGELDYWCGVKGLPDAFDEVLQNALQGRVRIEELDGEDYERILAIRSQYRDLRVGFVDAAVLAVVERLGERRLATLDRRHFAVMRPRHVAALELLPARR
jgi:predicted nucleic acid-binding protein